VTDEVPRRADVLQPEAVQARRGSGQSAHLVASGPIVPRVVRRGPPASS
jgi:hypothetical protein